MIEWIEAQWPAPARVRALSTLRRGGVSTGPYASANFGAHVGDDPDAVAANRTRLQTMLPGTPELCWLAQVHGTRVIAAGSGEGNEPADAQWTLRRGMACAVLTADCLPVLLCDRAGTRVAAAHAGWRGLAAGVLEATVAALQAAPRELMAWLGPAIGPHAFEVGTEVRTAFLEAGSPSEAFRPAPPQRGARWYADLYRLARERLLACGVEAVYGGGYCTWTESARFFSYRRDGVCGRQASLIYLQP